MSASDEALIDRFLPAGAEFARRLRDVRPEQWHAATPCPEWDVRDLVNHMTRGNLGYPALLDGGTAAEFLRLRDADALGGDPVGAYLRSVRECAAAFGRPGVLERELDHPLGRIGARQALAVRTADSVVHTWDLARALSADDRLPPGLTAWVDEHLAEIYAGLAETPVSPDSSHRFFGPAGTPGPGAGRQERLLHRMGRRPGWAPPRAGGGRPAR